MFARKFPLVTILLSVLLLPLAGIEAEDSQNQESPQRRTLGVFVFPGFELLDAMGPLEMFGVVGPELRVVMVAKESGEVASTQRVKTVADHGFADCPKLDMLLVPGGFGAMQVVNDDKTLAWLREKSKDAELTLSVCNGSQILAAAGILDGRRATTNKAYYSQITNAAPAVNWVKEARWVDDGNLVTSSGVSAGIDMALHVIARLYGNDRAETIARLTEYQWHRDADKDPFAATAR